LYFYAYIRKIISQRRPLLQQADGVLLAVGGEGQHREERKED